MKIRKYITIIGLLVLFGIWIAIGPYIIASFKGENEVALEEVSIELNDSNNITYAIEKINSNTSSYREIVEIAGYAFGKINKDIINREIEVILTSKNRSYTAQTQLIDRQEIIKQVEPELEGETLPAIGFSTKFSGMTIKNGKYSIGLIVNEDGNEKLQYTRYILTKEAGKITIAEDINSGKVEMIKETEDLSTYGSAVGSLDIFVPKSNSVFYVYGWGMNELKEVNERTIKMIFVSGDKKYSVPCKIIYRYGLIKEIDGTVNEEEIISPAFEALFDMSIMEDGIYETYIVVNEDGEKYIIPCMQNVKKQADSIEIYMK